MPTTLQLPRTDNHPEIQKRVDAYNRLSGLHQAIIHILAIIYSPTARTHILNSLKKLYPDDAKIKRFKVSDIDPVLDHLVQEGIVKQDEMQFQCLNFLMDPICRFLVDNGRFAEFADAVQRAIPMSLSSFPSYELVFREIRISTYRKDVNDVDQLIDYYDRHYASHNRLADHPFVGMFRYAFDADWVRRNLPEALQADIAAVLVDYFQRTNASVSPNMLVFLRHYSILASETPLGRNIRSFLAEQLVFNGQLDEAEKMVADDPGMSPPLISGVTSFLRDANSEAITHFAAALEELKKGTRKRKVYFESVSGLFYILALVKSDDPQQMQTAKTFSDIGVKDSRSSWQRTHMALGLLIGARQGDPDALASLREWIVYFNRENPIAAFIQCLAVYWMHKRKGPELVDALKFLHGVATNTHGTAWLLAEVSTLLVRLKVEGYDDVQAMAFFEQSGIQSIIDLVQPKSRWQQALTALISLDRQAAPAVGSDRPSRLVWLFDWNEGHEYWTLAPREQVKTAGGKWSKGRKIALKRLYYERDTFDFLTAQDNAVCACIQEERSYYRGYPEVSYDFSERALIALAGHPLVFSEEDPSVQLEVVRESPALVVNREKGGKYSLEFADDVVARDSDVQLVWDSPTRVRVIETDPDVRLIAKIIGNGLKVPAAGKKQLLDAVARVSSMVTVHSQIAGVGQTAEAATADPTPNIHLRHFGQGLKLDVWVQPFAPEGPCFRPGEGGETVICDVGGKSLRTQRDLERERQLADTAVAACPTLAAMGESDADRWQWDLPDPETCLETLVELNALDPPAVLKWPDGEPFTVRPPAEMKRFFVNVKKEKDWFALSGELKLDDGLVLSMERLLDLLETAKGRFIQLDDGQFLALTRVFRKRLEELSAYSKKSGKNRYFHPLAALSLETLAGEVGGFHGDKHWTAHLRQFKDARALTPEMPSTLKRDLRGYQVEGFVWLARLSHWGVGACLADDMGLGKTIQALAVMLTRAAGGPSLVVAPTSVCMNWETEAHHFAPSLNVVSLGNGDREKIVADLGPFDLLLISYGLLQQEKVAGMLAGIPFETIVLDEAQAIKNLATKRSQAAMTLDGHFRLITTGTPIENHLGELWNLFRFINPGLLGSLKNFNEKFALPIEKEGDPTVRQRLKKLVQPFILRRTKSQVLEELPQRTDILMPVELSTGELAFYEALRRQALESLSGEDAPSENMHLKILAEIMKLRRACCNPKLVLPDADLPSAKLSAFAEIVDELLAGGHKALVFSQFTGHLDLIRKVVEEKSIHYQYLDGSTPQKERQRRVAAFQNGDGDLFLISLKAGGVGLNLTAADYVIHMDPWWNPAVEDQAADRAHRIGQTRPVTVYRLIARHTIEEKIVALHRSKRDLADSLLDGTDMSGKMSADALLALIREG